MNSPVLGALSRRMLLLCLLASFFLPLAARLLELSLWDESRMAVGEYLLTRLEGYRWLAAASGNALPSDHAHPLTFLLRFFGAFPGLEPASAAFWLPLFFGCLLSVAVFGWAWALGYPAAGVLAGGMASMAPAFFTRSMLGDYGPEPLLPLAALLIGFAPMLWLRPWLRPPLLFLYEAAGRVRAFAGTARARCGRRAVWSPSPPHSMRIAREVPGADGMSEMVADERALGFVPLFLLALAGFAGWTLLDAGDFFRMTVIATAVSTPLFILLFAPPMVRGRLLGGALCHSLPLIGGWPGVWGGLILAFTQGFALHPEAWLGGAARVSEKARRIFYSSFFLGAAWVAVLFCALMLMGIENPFSENTALPVSAAAPTPVEDANPPWFPPPLEASSVATQSPPSASSPGFGTSLHPWGAVLPVAVAGFFLLLLIYPVLWYLAILPILAWLLNLPDPLLAALPGLALGVVLAPLRFGGDLYALALRRAARPIHGPSAARALRAARVIRRIHGLERYWTLVSLRLGLVLLGAFLLLGPIVARMPDWLAPTALSKDLAEALAFIRSEPGRATEGKKESMVWQWGPWGYAACHFSGRPALGGAGTEKGTVLSTYLPAAVYAQKDPVQANRLLRIGEEGEDAVATLAASLAERGGPDPEAVARFQVTEYAASGGEDFRGREARLVVSLDFLPFAEAITRTGTWDFAAGSGRGVRMQGPLESLRGNVETGIFRVNENTLIYAASLDSFGGDGLMRHVYYRLTGGMHLVSDARSGEARNYVMRDSLYNMLLYRLLVAAPDDPDIAPYFELLYDNGCSRVYRPR